MNWLVFVKALAVTSITLLCLAALLFGLAWIELRFGLWWSVLAAIVIVCVVVAAAAGVATA